jgi:alpha-tubulin suppressor-like RCC1 family protein
MKNERVWLGCLCASFGLLAGCQATLSVVMAGSGAGTVAIAPGGVTCGAAGTPCSTSGNNGESRTLTATAGTGSQFAGWGGVCSGGSTCSVTLNGAQMAIAYFRTTQVAAGAFHTCALKVDGTVKCWGRNNEGELGQGYLQNSAPGLANTVSISGSVAAISAGAYHTCILLAGGTVNCWGSNTYYQIQGPQQVDPIASPNYVVNSNTAPVLAVAAGGYHTCEVMSDGTAMCWGYNHDGEASWASGAGNLQIGAVAIPGVAGATQISAGAYHSCALLSSGSVDCWGYNNDGETGTAAAFFNAHAISALQIDAATGAGVNGVSVFGGYHTCALLTGGSVSCWGYNGYGELGNGTNAGPQPTGTAVTASLPGAATMVTAGGYHSCAIVGGAVMCWGANDNAQLGRGAWGPAIFTPAVISGAPAGSALSVDAGAYHTCAVFTGTDNVKCWGRNNEGESGALQVATVTTPNTPWQF